LHKLKNNLFEFIFHLSITFETRPKIIAPQNLQKIQNLKINLDEGESQAIALALEINCDLILMDERIGTNIARQEGLQTVGLVGVLIKAKQQKIIESVGDILFDLRREAGFWLNPNLEKKILEEIGEA
jgi:hypothetical protein